MRINAWSEITAMAVSFVVAVFLQLVYPHLGFPVLTSWQRLLIVMGITTVAWVGVTLLTKPTDAVTQADFKAKIHTSRHDIAWGLLAMTIACAAVYSAMFSVGYWLYSETTMAIITTSIFVVSTAFLIPVVRRLNGKQA